jgi:hypothetical protein
MDDDPVKFIDLQEMVTRAVATPELKDLFPESRCTVEQIAEQITPKLPDILSIVSDEMAALQKSNAGLEAAEERLHGLEPSSEKLIRRKNWARFLTFASGLLLAAALIGSAVVFTGRVPGWVLATEIVPGGLFAAMLIAWLTLARVLERTSAAIRAIEQEIANLKKQRDELVTRLRQTIYDKGIRSEINGILSQATASSYETRLGDHRTGTGLSEVFASAHEVETQARRDLNELLSLPGASIGLAGPRGAGKTTLMSLVANRPWAEGKGPCSILCPAPVEYTGRDYLVTLFLLLCKWVIRDRDPSSLSPRLSVSGGERPAAPWSQDLTLYLLRLAKPVFWSGLALTMLGLYLGFLLMKAPSAPEASTPPAQQQQQAPSAKGSSSPHPVQQPQTAAPPPQSAASRPSARAYLALYVKTLGVSPATLLEWGLAMLLCGWAVPYILTRTSALRSFSVGGSTFELSDLSPKDDLLSTAQTYMEALRFQQSYTSGWSGSLKMPFGVEGGVNDAQTLSRNQRTLPELVSDFREFLQLLVGTYGRVVIGIDELDKLESDSKAHLFLNEIKAVFGVSGVIYLISVSENAISAFERRGLPFRDVFDSSFDTIVHVNYLTLRESKELLKRRTTRIPEPFLCLCHCLSGGLPRDLIRSCRDMLDIANEDKTLELGPLAERVVTHEARSKARGMSIAASKLGSDSDQTQFLGVLTDLLTANLDEPKLMERAAALLASARTLRAKLDQIPVSGQPRPEQFALADLQMEFGLYLAYLATVLAVLAKPQNRDQWLAAEGNVPPQSGNTNPLQRIACIFDQLTAVRQALAISSSVGQQLLLTFRASHDLSWSALTPS